MSDKKPSAVHLLAFEHPGLAQSLRGKLIKLRADYAVQLSENSAQGIEDYRHRTGVIRGIKEAIEICEQLEQDLRGD